MRQVKRREIAFERSVDKGGTSNVGVLPFDEKYYYRMPIGFGPFPGPRQIPFPGKRDSANSPRRTLAAVTFETDLKAVGALLPCGFSPSIATVTVEVQHLEGIDWLANRGYSTLGVKFPVEYKGTTEHLEGDFLAVLWENLADPIISGREELGYSKLWCDIQDTVKSSNSRKFSAIWLGHQFFTMELSNLRESTKPPIPRRALLHYKYIPKTGCPGHADAAYAVVTPAHNPNIKIEKHLVAEGSFKFVRSEWAELPTLFHIVNALADLPLLRFKSACLTVSRGGKDLSDQRIIG